MAIQHQIVIALIAMSSPWRLANAAPVGDVASATAEERAERQDAISAAIRREAATCHDTPDAELPGDAEIRRRLGGQTGTEIELWGEGRAVAINGYVFRIGCRYNANLFANEVVVKWPQATYLRQESPPLVPTNTAEARGDDIARLRFREGSIASVVARSGGRFSGPVCGGATANRTIDVIGEESGAILSFPSQVVCQDCAARDCAVSVASPNAAEPAPLATSAQVAARRQQGHFVVAMAPPTPESDGVAEAIAAAARPAGRRETGNRAQAVDASEARGHRQRASENSAIGGSPTACTFPKNWSAAYSTNQSTSDGYYTENCTIDVRGRVVHQRCALACTDCWAVEQAFSIVDAECAARIDGGQYIELRSEAHSRFWQDDHREAAVWREVGWTKLRLGFDSSGNLVATETIRGPCEHCMSITDWDRDGSHAISARIVADEGSQRLPGHVRAAIAFPAPRPVGVQIWLSDPPETRSEPSRPSAPPSHKVGRPAQLVDEPEKCAGPYASGNCNIGKGPGGKRGVR